MLRARVLVGVRLGPALGLALALALPACGAPAKPSEVPDESPPSAPDEPPPDPAPSAPAGPVHPAPFTAEQIRAATREGRTYRYKVEVPNHPATERVVTFAKVDDGGAEVFAGGPGPKRFAWKTLQQQTEFPKDRVTTREEQYKGPAGKYDCVVYLVRGDDGETTTYYFAKKLPGAPILYFTEHDGTRTKTVTLVEHIGGK